MLVELSWVEWVWDHTCLFRAPVQLWMLASSTRQSTRGSRRAARALSSAADSWSGSTAISRRTLTAQCSTINHEWMNEYFIHQHRHDTVKAAKSRTVSTGQKGSKSTYNCPKRKRQIFWQHMARKRFFLGQAILDFLTLKMLKMVLT